MPTPLPDRAWKNALSQASNSIIVCLDTEGGLLELNSAGERLLGKRREDLLGVDFIGHFIPSEFQERVRTDLQRVLSGESIRDYHESLPGTDGILTLVWEAVPLLGEEGEVLGAMGIGRDITEILRAEKAKESRIQLAARLSSLGTLASGMAHELNNPLSYVLANLSYAIEVLGSMGKMGELQEVLSALQDALEGATRVRDIVADLKTFARIDDPVEKELDLKAVLEVALRVTRHALKQRAQLQLGPLPSAPVWGNHARLAQAFVNLLLHCAGRLPREEREQHHLRLLVLKREAEVIVEIEDDGTPLPPPHLDHLFYPWFETRPDVSGLSLSLAQSTIRQMGGSIEVESEEGRTVLRVRLPVAGPCYTPNTADTAAASGAPSEAQARTASETRRRGSLP